MGLAMNSLQAPAFHAWADYLKKRIDYEAAQRGYEVEFTELNANNDVTKQANDIKDLIAKGCKVIFCPCLDSKAILQSVQEVHDAGAIYVSYCREVSKEATGSQVPDITVNFSSEEQAYVGVMKLFDIMKADGVTPVKMIDVFGDTTDENSHNRETGLRRALKDAGYENLPVVTVDCGRWEPDVAMQNAEPVLAANPDANCMYVSSDFLMSGVQTAMENANMWFPRGEEGHVYTDTSDMFPIGIDLLRQKYIDTAVDQGCYNFAVEAAKSAFDLLEGKEVEKVQLVLGTQATDDDIEQVLATTPLWGNDYRD
jgi:ABC-type sugar transport system substrate-binding protein